MFIKPTEAGIPTRHIDALSNKTSGKRMEAFLKIAGKDQTAYVFKKGSFRVRTPNYVQGTWGSSLGEVSRRGGEQNGV
jgi:hypothetical protein